MDIIFKCPDCDQELAVDASGAGTQIQCPSCSSTLTVPEGQPEEAAAAAPPAPPPPKVEKHFVVPVHSVPAEALIQKARRPLDIAAKEGDKKLRIRTFKHSECQEVGHDRFDETVSEFLEKVGQANIVSVTAINYSFVELGTRAIITDFGVMIVFKG